MKRSLALGALMAFVITGSAMAADYSTKVTNWDIDLDGFKTNVAYDTISITHDSGWANTYYAAMVVKDKSALTANNKIEINTDGWVSGIMLRGDDPKGKMVELSAPTIIMKNIGSKSGIHVDNDNGEAIVKNFSKFSIYNGEEFESKVGHGGGSGIRVNRDGASVTVEGNAGSTIEIDAGESGVVVSANGTVTLSAGTINIITEGNNYNGSYKGQAVANSGSGTIKILATDKISLKNDNVNKNDSVCAVYGSNGTIIIGSDDKAEEKATVEVNGNVQAKGSASINLKLETKDSVLNGAVKDENVSGADKGTNLLLSNGATWNVTGDSVVTNVEGDGTIKLDMVSENAVATVNAGSISETTTVGATGAVTDYIAGLSETEQTAVMQDVVNAVKVGKNTFTDTVTTDEGLIAGSYTLTKNTDGTVTSTQAANQTNTAIGESAVALKAHWRAHMNDMNKRMGELRNANGEHGVWTRMVRGEAEYAGVKAQYNQYQLGYDEKLSVDKRWTVGAAVTFSEGDSNFYKGSTEDDSTAFAIYGSKLNNDGTFVDLIARYAHLESDITTATDKSDYSTNGMSVSAEFGKRIQQGNGMWIEPQVELTYGSVDSAEYVLDGKKVQVGDMDSLIGRVGFSIGKDIEKGNVYARASYLYDFDGETETSFSAGGLNDTIKEDLGGGWWEVGVGANINLSKATYIYADIEKTFGGEVDTNWQWNLGVRYSF